MSWPTFDREKNIYVSKVLISDCSKFSTKNFHLENLDRKKNKFILKKIQSVTHKNWTHELRNEWQKIDNTWHVMIWNSSLYFIQNSRKPVGRKNKDAGFRIRGTLVQNLAAFLLFYRPTSYNFKAYGEIEFDFFETLTHKILKFQEKTIPNIQTLLYFRCSLAVPLISIIGIE